MKSEKLDVAVTSRAAEGNALWMLNHLRSPTYKDLLGRVTHLPISNSNQAEWRSEMQKHSFSILYHTKRQGRLNLTDVTDSLYDLELQELSERLGRDSVMVVVADLLKSDEEEKQRILTNQPSISRWASELVLFAENEKYPIPIHKQQVFLQTFQRAHKKNQQKRQILQKNVIYGLVGCIALVLLVRWRWRKKIF
ncbi:uncharacterized protein LOC143785034 isoform X1 [Ranitomeya variabilis]|uniref:uncharacterized protein LOC143785034 isoform X1 n=1 Tax=Ranitomeya variabilis TaxID=490064 RepID=UPI00405673BF